MREKFDKKHISMILKIMLKLLDPPKYVKLNGQFSFLTS